MNAHSTIDAPEEKLTGLALLRAPFPPHLISKKPKPLKKDAPKGRCSECGGWHGLPAVHLDYVGHAALTQRLLEADPDWDWEPVAYGADGLPALDANGGMWIRLTVCGKVRLGYGHADGKRGGDAVKEVIGDALRNAAMRFGAALDLWHKGDLHASEEAQSEPDQRPAPNDDRRTRSQRQDSQQQGGGMPDYALAKLQTLVQATQTNVTAMLEHYRVKSLNLLSEAQYVDAVDRLEADLARITREQSNQRGGFDPSDIDNSNL